MKKGKFKAPVLIAGAVLFLTFALAVEAGHDDDFKRASNLNYYSGLPNTKQAELLVNIASVLHQENLQIIQILQNLQERLNKLEASIKTIEQQVAGK